MVHTIENSRIVYLTSSRPSTIFENPRPNLLEAVCIVEEGILLCDQEWVGPVSQASHRDSRMAMPPTKKEAESALLCLLGD